MTSKTVYTTTYQCDACKKQIKVKEGDITQDEWSMGRSLSLSFTRHYFPTLDDGRNNDFCEDCDKSFKEWKKSRSAEIINELL